MASLLFFWYLWSVLTRFVFSSHSYYEAALLSSLDFFLDLGADSTFPPDIDVRYSYRRQPTLRSQFIHRSGTMLLSVLEPGDVDGAASGFAFVANQNYILHKGELGPRYEALVEELRSVCADGERLERFWAEARAQAGREGRLGRPEAAKGESGQEA